MARIRQRPILPAAGLLLALLLFALVPGVLAQSSPGPSPAAPSPAAPLKFVLALLPLLVVLAGIVFFQRSGTTMALVGWVVSVLLARGLLQDAVARRLGRLMVRVSSSPSGSRSRSCSPCS